MIGDATGVLLGRSGAVGRGVFGHRLEAPRTHGGVAAIGILAFHDLTPTSVNAETETLSFTLPYAAIEKVAVLVDELESSGYFHDVQPRTDGTAQTLTLEMKVREAAPPLTPEP